MKANRKAVPSFENAVFSRVGLDLRCRYCPSTDSEGGVSEIRQTVV